MEVQIGSKLIKLDDFPMVGQKINPQNIMTLKVLVHPVGLEPATC